MNKYLGNFSAAPPERSIGLDCHPCGVSWTGCQDAAACPRCGSTEAYEERTKVHYLREEYRKENYPVSCHALIDNMNRLKELHVQLRGILDELEESVR